VGAVNADRRSPGDRTGDLGRPEPLGEHGQRLAGFGTGEDGCCLAPARVREARVIGMAVVKINAIEVPEGAGEELEKRFAARLGTVEKSPGFIAFELLRPVAGDNRYFVYTKWESEEAYQAWANGPARAAHAHGPSDGDAAPRRPVATGATLLEFEVVQESTAQR